MEDKKEIFDNILHNISNDKLGKVVGGFSGMTAWNGNSMTLNQQEYDELCMGGFITDGKLKNKDVIKAGKYLSEKGFKGRIFGTGLIPKGVRKEAFASGDDPARITIKE